VAKTVTTNTASFELTLVNTQDDTDVTKRTISFDLPYNTTIASSDQLITIASTYFAVAGMSNVFQPTGWRDYEGAVDIYTLQAVTPVFTEKTVSESEPVTVQGGN